jgi:CBS domain-containing protein
VTDAANILARYKIGAVIVSRDGSAVDGILSERDIVRALGTTGIDCMTKQVKDLMTSEVTGCRMDDTANSAMETMSSGRFRHMPVVEDGKLVGVISIGDVVQARINEIQSENSALTGMISNNW